MNSISDNYPMDPDVLLIREKQLKKKEKEIKIKEAQMGFFLHDMSYVINCLDSYISFYNHLDKESDFKNKTDIYYNIEIKELLYHLRVVFKTYQFYFNPNFFAKDLFTPKDVYSIVSRICSFYSSRMRKKGIVICITNSLMKENKPCLSSSFELAVAMIVDNAIVLAPDNSDFNISFYEVDERLTVEFKNWERCYEGGDVYSKERSFGSSIIWNTEDENIALTLFKQMCDYNNIIYGFSKGDEKKVINNENCQSYVVNLTFNLK